jgi:hypothetical protein
VGFKSRTLIFFCAILFFFLCLVDLDGEQFDLRSAKQRAELPSRPCFDFRLS